MNGTSNQLDFRTKVEGWNGFTYDKLPGFNDNTGRLCLQTTDLDNMPAGGDPSMWDDMDWDDRGDEPLMNYDDEARKLFEQLNLPDPTVENTKDKGLFSDLRNMPNAVYQHPTTGAQFFIGGEFSAKERWVLDQYKIYNIICAKGSTGPLYHVNDPKFTYLPWHIESLPRMKPHLKDGEQIFNFLHPVHSYIQSCLERGENVMVHCMAGAHRAGTTGVSYMMKASGLGYEDARRVARKVRPVVDPCGQLETLLKKQEEAAKEVKIQEDLSKA